MAQDIRGTCLKQVVIVSSTCQLLLSVPGHQTHVELGFQHNQHVVGYTHVILTTIALWASLVMPVINALQQASQLGKTLITSPNLTVSHFISVLFLIDIS